MYQNYTVRNLVSAFNYAARPKSARVALRDSTVCTVGRDSSVGVATRYGLDGPVIESRWGGEIFRTRPYRPWGPPSLLYNGYWISFSGVKRPGRGVPTLI